MRLFEGGGFGGGGGLMALAGVRHGGEGAKCSPIRGCEEGGMTKANAQAGTYEGSRVTGEMFLQKIGGRECVEGGMGIGLLRKVVDSGETTAWRLSRGGQCALAKTRPCLPHSPDPEGAPSPTAAIAPACRDW